ncbi:MAG: transglutaminase-like cysteine peptidase [Rhizobiaceae bacterium]
MASFGLAKWLGTGAVVAAGLFAATFQASAGQPMATGGLTSQPIGHYEFCKTNPDECSIRSRDRGPVRMTGALWRKVVATNLAVNKAIKPMNDEDIYGKAEVWTYPTANVGDCEDYVLAKQRGLVESGVPTSDLLITVVRKPDGEGHAVLTLRTDKGDFVLDNLSDQVRQWDETGYRFLKRQSSTDTGRWVSIREGQTATVAAVE